MNRKNSFSVHRDGFGLLLGFLCALVVQSAAAVSPPDYGSPYVAGDTIYWTSPYWHQVQSRTTSEFVCTGGSSCRVVNGPYWVTEHRPDGSGSGFLVHVVDGEDATRPVLTAESFVDAVTVDGAVISWPAGGWYQVQDTETYTERCYGYISSCRLDSPGEYKVINHSLGLNTKVMLGQNVDPVDDRFLLEGSVLSLPEDGWYQVQSSDTYATICEGVTSCTVSPGIYNIINHTSGERFEGYLVPDVIPDRPFLTRAECATSGGSVIGDIGDGAIHSPEYRCVSGASPVGTITYLEGEPIAFEGEVCCI